MKTFAVARGAKEAELVGRILCHDVRGPRNEIVFRKGYSLRAADMALLVASPWSEIHLLELGPDDAGQREAGEQLASSLSSAALRSAASGHRHVLRASQDGLLKIDVAALQRLNSIPGMAVFTLYGEQVVSAGQIVAEAQITPLAVERRRIEEAQKIVREAGGLIRILPFVPRGVIVWMRDGRVVGPLSEKLERFGCSIRAVAELPRDADSISRTMEDRAGSDATLFVVSGTNALDPLDPVFAALEQMGAKMQRIGVPMHPGTLLWIASWRDVTVIGLPSCGIGAQVTAFDIVLPKLLAEGAIGDGDLAALGHGGILNAGRRNVILSRSSTSLGEGSGREGSLAESTAQLGHSDEPVR